MAEGNLAKLKRGIVSSIAKKADLAGTNGRAPSYALLQLEASQIDTFNRVASMLAKEFDHVLVLKPENVEPKKVPSNVQIFDESSDLKSRWQLLGKCDDGFVFPISLLKPIEKDHARWLKDLLFAIGGANAVAFHNFSGDQSGFDADGKIAGLVPVPQIDPDYSVFDQRFWGLSYKDFDQWDDASSLCNSARQREFGLFAFPRASAASSLSAKPKHIMPRIELLETLVRNPGSLKRLDGETLDWLAKFWNSAGAKSPAKTPLELEESLTKILQKSSSVKEDAEYVVSKLVGKKLKKSRGV